MSGCCRNGVLFCGGCGETRRGPAGGCAAFGVYWWWRGRQGPGRRGRPAGPAGCAGGSGAARPGWGAWATGAAGFAWANRVAWAAGSAGNKRNEGRHRRGRTCRVAWRSDRWIARSAWGAGSAGFPGRAWSPGRTGAKGRPGAKRRAGAERRHGPSGADRAGWQGWARRRTRPTRCGRAAWPCGATWPPRLHLPGGLQGGRVHDQRARRAADALGLHEVTTDDPATLFLYARGR